MKTIQHWINGAPTAGASLESTPVFNPATGQEQARVALGSAAVFPTLVSAIGISNTFFLFVVAGVLSLTFVKRYVPETKGRSLETLEAELRARFS